jgi:hypothetical protein
MQEREGVLACLGDLGDGGGRREVGAELDEGVVGGGHCAPVEPGGRVVEPEGRVIEHY